MLRSPSHHSPPIGFRRLQNRTARERRASQEAAMVRHHKAVSRYIPAADPGINTQQNSSPTIALSTSNSSFRKQVVDERRLSNEKSQKLVEAAELGDTDKVQDLVVSIEAGDETCPNLNARMRQWFGETALLKAAMCGRLATVNLLARWALSLPFSDLCFHFPPAGAEGREHQSASGKRGEEWFFFYQRFCCTKCYPAGFDPVAPPVHSCSCNQGTPFYEGAISTLGWEGDCYVVRSKGPENPIVLKSGPTALRLLPSPELGWSRQDGEVDCQVEVVQSERQVLDVDDPDNFLMTPLMKAARNGHVHVVNKLLHMKADFHRRDHDGWDAVVHAAERGHWQVVQLLINDPWNAKFSRAELSKFYEGLQQLKQLRNRTAWMVAAENGHLGVMRVLLQVYRERREKAEQEKRLAIVAYAHASASGTNTTGTLGRTSRRDSMHRNRPTIKGIDPTTWLNNGGTLRRSSAPTEDPTQMIDSDIDLIEEFVEETSPPSTTASSTSPRARQITALELAMQHGRCHVVHWLVSEGAKYSHLVRQTNGQCRLHEEVVARRLRVGNGLAPLLQAEGGTSAVGGRSEQSATDEQIVNALYVGECDRKRREAAAIQHDSLPREHKLRVELDSAVVAWRQAQRLRADANRSKTEYEYESAILSMISALQLLIPNPETGRWALKQQRELKAALVKEALSLLGMLNRGFPPPRGGPSRNREQQGGVEDSLDRKWRNLVNYLPKFEARQTTEGTRFHGLVRQRIATMDHVEATRLCALLRKLRFEAVGGTDIEGPVGPELFREPSFPLTSLTSLPLNRLVSLGNPPGGMVSPGVTSPQTVVEQTLTDKHQMAQGQPKVRNCRSCWLCY